MDASEAFRRGAVSPLAILLLASALHAAAPLPSSKVPPHSALAPKGFLPSPVMPASGGQGALPGLRRHRRADVDPKGLLGRVRGFERGPFRLDLGVQAWDLELERSSVRSPGYVVRHLTSRGVVEAEPVPEQTFRGHVRGKPGSKVRLSFQDGRINGFVDEGDGDRTYVEPLDHFQSGPALPSTAARIGHAIYRESDVVPTAGVHCGTAAPADLRSPGGQGPGLPPGGFQSPGMPSFPGGLPSPSAPDPESDPLRDQIIQAPPGLGKSAAASAEPCALVELAVAVEYSMVKGLGTAAAVEKRINDIYNMVDGLYQDPLVNIHVRISEILIETEQKNTWGAEMDINKYLNSLTSWMTGANGFKKPFDVGTMWYYQLGGGTVGLAWVGVVCNNNRSNVIRYFTATSRSMMIDAAHEMGHNFGANHIENPAWIMNPAITGSNDKWDPTTIASVTGHKKSRSCLSACNVAPIAAFGVQGPGACADTRTFTDQSAGDPTAWLWEFGDGTSSNVRNPVHTYPIPGRYTVSLSSSNAFGADRAVNGNIKVLPIAAPTGKDADGCPPAALTLEAQGTGTLRWYDTASGGSPQAIGNRFTTPVLSKARAYYVEDGEADPPMSKVGPAAPSIGPGQFFTNNGDRRLFFDVHRPATLISAKVSSGAAGPRIVEILDAKDKRIASKTVQMPAGESRVALGFSLQPGVDYALKVVGSGDSVNLYRNASGADYPYLSPDTLVTITGSDATAADSVTQAGYYYYFYDWEIRETPCTSVRVPVQAKFNCPTQLAGAGEGAFHASLRPVAPGLLLVEGMSPSATLLTVSLRTLDGALVRRLTQSVGAGSLSIPLTLEAAPAQLLTVEIHLGDYQSRKILPRF